MKSYVVLRIVAALLSRLKVSHRFLKETDQSYTNKIYSYALTEFIHSLEYHAAAVMSLIVPITQ